MGHRKGQGGGGCSQGYHCLGSATAASADFSAGPSMPHPDTITSPVPSQLASPLPSHCQSPLWAPKPPVLQFFYAHTGSQQAPFLARRHLPAEWGGAKVEEVEAAMPGGAGEIEYVRVRGGGAAQAGSGWEAAHPRQVSPGWGGQGCCASSDGEGGVLRTGREQHAPRGAGVGGGGGGPLWPDDGGGGFCGGSCRTTCGMTRRETGADATLAGG